MEQQNSTVVEEKKTFSSPDELKREICRVAEELLSEASIFGVDEFIPFLRDDMSLPINVFARHPAIQALSDDYNFIAESLALSKVLTVDYVRACLLTNVPKTKRNVVAFRGISAEVPKEELESVCSGLEDFVELAVDGDSWVARFATEDAAVSAITEMRTRQFQGNPVRGYVKTEDLLLRSLERLASVRISDQSQLSYYQPAVYVQPEMDSQYYDWKSQSSVQGDIRRSPQGQLSGGPSGGMYGMKQREPRRGGKPRGGGPGMPGGRGGFPRDDDRGGFGGRRDMKGPYAKRGGREFNREGRDVRDRRDYRPRDKSESSDSSPEVPMSPTDPNAAPILDDGVFKRPLSKRDNRPPVIPLSEWANQFPPLPSRDESPKPSPNAASRAYPRSAILSCLNSLLSDGVAKPSTFVNPTLVREDPLVVDEIFGLKELLATSVSPAGVQEGSDKSNSRKSTPQSHQSSPDSQHSQLTPKSYANIVRSSPSKSSH